MPSSSPSTGSRPSWVDATLFPFESRFLDIDGHDVHYVDEGKGPVLLFLHGNPTWSFLYRDVIATLREDFRCVALDYPGFGLSTPSADYRFWPADHAAVVRTFVERLDLADVTLVVHDWGGPIGVHAAAADRQRYQGLVVANSWAWPVNGDLHFEAFSRMMGGPLGRELIRRLNLLVNGMMPVGHRRRKLSAAEMAHYREALATRDRRHASAVLPQAITAATGFLHDVEAGLEELADLPALLLWADKDIAFREKELRRWERTLEHSTTVSIAGAGHYVPSDAADEVADAIRGWFGSPAGPGHPPALH